LAPQRLPSGIAASRSTRRWFLSVGGCVGIALLTGAAAAWAEEARGLFVFGHEAHTVRLCGDTRTLWVHATERIQSRLRAEYDRLATGPYAEVYLEFEGEIVERPASGFSADHDGIIEVREVRSMTRAGEDPCSANAKVALERSAADPAATTYVLVCPDQAEAVVRASESDAWVFRAAGSLRLPAVPGSPSRAYSDGSFELRIEGEQAQWGRSGKPLQTCRNDRRRAIWERAKLDGVDFRAVGNEPAWVLEIQQQSRIVLLTDYGAKRVELPLPPPEEDREARKTRWDAGELQVEAIAHPCNDSMSGEAFESEVVVTWQGQTLRGCGRALH
jgi:uncharacterized membrane protein